MGQEKGVKKKDGKDFTDTILYVNFDGKSIGWSGELSTWWLRGEAGTREAVKCSSSCLSYAVMMPPHVVGCPLASAIPRKIIGLRILELEGWLKFSPLQRG